jgi:hypothetical protein
MRWPIYGFQGTDTFNTVLASRDFPLAMLKVVKTGNFVNLGRTLAGLVVQAEFSIRDGIYRTVDKRTGRMKVLDTDLPFERWIDALPRCVEALQETGHDSDIDMADILQIKYLMMMRKPHEAVPCAKAAIERSPHVSYFYYTMTLVADMEEGLKYAKKGMKCRLTSKFLHFGMMKQAIEFAGNLGISALGSKPAGGGKELGVAFLTSALEDAKDFIANAPPDSRHMPEVVVWYMLTTLTLKGPKLCMSLVDFVVSVLKAYSLAALIPCDHSLCWKSGIWPWNSCKSWGLPHSKARLISFLGPFLNTWTRETSSGAPQ